MVVATRTPTATAVLADSAAPSCALSAIGTNASGQKFVQVTIQDSQSGLASVTLTTLTNSIGQVGNYATRIALVPTTVSITDHTTNPVIVTATKLNQSLGSQLALQLTDVAGNVTRCDPQDVTLERLSGKPVRSILTGVSHAEHYVEVANGTPGLTHLRIRVNHEVFQVEDLEDGEVRQVNVESAMEPGEHNVVVLTPLGKPGGTAWVLLSDRPLKSRRR
jgi:hypothetical protein